MNWVLGLSQLNSETHITRNVTVNKENYFHKESLPLWMAFKNMPYRKPRAYADQLSVVHVEIFCIFTDLG